MQIFTLEQKYEIVARIAMLVEQGVLEWDAINDYSFSAELGHTEYTIVSPDRDDVFPFTLYIRIDGEPFTSIDSGGAPSSHVQAINRGLQSIYNAAKRNALKIDQSAIAVLEELREATGGAVPDPPAPPGPLDDVPF